MPNNQKYCLVHGRTQDFFVGVGKFIGVARIFSGVHFFLKNIDDLFSRRPQNTGQARPTKWTTRPSKNCENNPYWSTQRLAAVTAHAQNTLQHFPGGKWPLSMPAGAHGLMCCNLRLWNKMVTIVTISWRFTCSNDNIELVSWWGFLVSVEL